MTIIPSQIVWYAPLTFSCKHIILTTKLAVLAAPCPRQFATFADVKQSDEDDILAAQGVWCA